MNKQAKFTKDDEAWVNGYFVGIEDHDCLLKRMMHIREVLSCWWRWKRVEWEKYRKSMKKKGRKMKTA